MGAPRSGREGLLALAVLVALVAGVLLLGTAGSRGGDPFEVRRSTRLTTPHGTKALFDLLVELGYDARRHGTSLRAVPPGAGTLCVLSAPVPVGQDEIRGVASWVEAGGTLVLTLGGGSLSPTAGLANRGTPGAALAEAFGVRAQRQPVSEREQRAQGELAGRTDRLRFLGGRTIEGPFTAQAGYRPLVSGPFGDIAGSAPRGRGRVIVFADDTPFTNRMIRHLDNAQMLILLLAHGGRSGTILFDERHQGYGEDREAVARLAGAISGTGLGLALLQAALAGTAMLLWAARRFGAPLPPPAARRRSALEAAAALGRAYHAANAASLALETLAAGARRRAAARLGIPPTLPPEEFAARLRASRAPGAAELAAALDRAAEVAAGGRGTEREFAAAARGLEKALALVTGGGSTEEGTA